MNEDIVEAVASKGNQLVCSIGPKKITTIKIVPEGFR
jgi:hypothetical protein